MNDAPKINWYRSQVDKQVISDLMKTSDFRGFCQVIPQLALFVTTGLLAYAAFRNIDSHNWPWAVPVLLLALFVHGTLSGFLGMLGPVHELCHKTPFRSKGLNEFFLKVYAFLSWSDHMFFRPSHIKHHQATVHKEIDGEVVLPMFMDLTAVKFYVTMLTCNPYSIYSNLRCWSTTAFGPLTSFGFRAEWIDKIMPESKTEQRREHRRWARTVVLGHAALAILFIATGHWPLIFVFNIGTMYCGWLKVLIGTPQHIGLSPDVADFRLCCRTYTCSWLPGFLYWNMQYHVEHHMFPAVPFFNLPKLREVLKHDLPPAPHGLLATWKELIPILKKQKEDPTYVFVPQLPQGNGERVNDEILEREAALRK